MYGTIIIPETEMTRRGEADVGVLFMHNGTYPFLLLAYLILIFDSSSVLIPELSYDWKKTATRQCADMPRLH